MEIFQTIEKITIRDKRNYNEIFNIYDGFTKLGFEDGYADFVSDHDNILKYLVLEKYLKEQIIDFIWEYLNGYEVGSFMSEKANVIYNEDGNLKEDEYAIECNDSMNKMEAIYLVEKRLVKE